MDRRLSRPSLRVDPPRPPSSNLPRFGNSGPRRRGRVNPAAKTGRTVLPAGSQFSRGRSGGVVAILAFLNSSVEHSATTARLRAGGSEGGVFQRADLTGRDPPHAPGRSSAAVAEPLLCPKHAANTSRVPVSSCSRWILQRLAVILWPRGHSADRGTGAAASSWPGVPRSMRLGASNRRRCGIGTGWREVGRLATAGWSGVRFEASIGGPRPGSVAASGDRCAGG